MGKIRDRIDRLRWFLPDPHEKTRRDILMSLAELDEKLDQPPRRTPVVVRTADWYMKAEYLEALSEARLYELEEMIIAEKTRRRDGL